MINKSTYPNSRTYLLRNQIHDLVKFFQANRGEFEITAVLGELRGTEDQKKLEIKIFDLLQREIRGEEPPAQELLEHGLETSTPETPRGTTKVSTRAPSIILQESQGHILPIEPEGNSSNTKESPVVVKGKRSRAKGISGNKE